MATPRRPRATTSPGPSGLPGVLLLTLAVSLLLGSCTPGSDRAPAPTTSSTTTLPAETLIPRSENDPAIEAERLGYRPPEVAPGLASSRVYAAFGDSISAGIGSGVFGYCGRTDGSWVAELARRDGAVFLNYACVGAKLEDLEEQVAAVDPVVDVAGVTLLGNDIGVAKVLAGCATGDCTAVVDDSLVTARSLLPRAEELLRRLGAGRTLVVSGYAASFSPEHLCNGPLDVSDHVDLARAVTGLSDLLESVVERMRKDGFDIAFSRPDVRGHELCSPDPWFFPLGAVGALHPTAPGQKAMAAAVPVLDKD
jgi:hypothetical protein